MTTVGNEKFEIKLPTLNGIVGEDFQLLELRVKTAIWGKDLDDTPSEETSDKKSTQRALSEIISALDDNPLRAIQKC